MWPYKDHDENEYNQVVKFVEEYTVSLGAKFVSTKEYNFTTIPAINISRKPWR